MDVKLLYKDKEYLIKDTSVTKDNFTYGNFLCDCNRSILIGLDLDCGKEIKLQLVEDGKTIYTEF